MLEAAGEEHGVEQAKSTEWLHQHQWQMGRNIEETAERSQLAARRRKRAAASIVLVLLIGVATTKLQSTNI